MVAHNAHQAGHQVHTLDLMFETDPDAVLQKELETVRPDIVGFSLRILDNQSMLKTHNSIPEFIRWIAMANRFAPTIAGGAAVTIAPEMAFKRLGATYGYAGQAERTFADFLAEIENGCTEFKTLGVIWRAPDGHIKMNPALADGYNACGSVDWNFVDFDRYRIRGLAPATVITKAGCVHRCIWCTVPKCFGSRYLPREPEAIVQDLKRDARDRQLNRYPYWFIDGIFNEPLDWSVAVLEKLIVSDVRVTFSVLAEPTKHMTLEYTRLLKRAGCALVCPMIGTGSEKLLALHERPFVLAEAMRGMQNLEEAGVAYIPSLLFGGPGETRETVEETFRTYSRLRPLVLSVGCGVRIIPQAKIEQSAREEGIIDDNTDLLEPAFYVSPQVDRQWLIERVARERRWKPSSLRQWARMIYKHARPRVENMRPRMYY